MNKILSDLRTLGYVNNSNEEIIAFGLKRMYGLFLDILGAVLCGAVMGNVMVGFLFELAYIPLRVYAGGYHASSEKKCNYLSFGSMVCCLAIIIFLPFHIYYQHFLMALSVMCVVILSPVESASKPLTRKEKQIFRRRSRIISFIELTVYIFAVFYNGKIAKTISISTALIAIGLIAGIIGNVKGSKKRESWPMRLSGIFRHYFAGILNGREYAEERE